MLFGALTTKLPAVLIGALAHLYLNVIPFVFSKVEFNEFPSRDERQSIQRALTDELYNVILPSIRIFETVNAPIPEIV